MVLGVVTQVHVVLCHDCVCQILKLHVPVVLFDPGLNGTVGFCNVDLPTFAGDAVYTRCFHAKYSLDALQETSNSGLLLACIGLCPFLNSLSHIYVHFHVQ